MARIEVILSGSPISDIQESLSKDEILARDLLYVSQQQLSNVNPDRTYDSGTNVYTNQFKSAKMSYGDLSTMLMERFREYAKFGSMAYESSSDYSLAQHSHDYSKVQIYSPNGGGDDMLSIAAFQIDHTGTEVLWMKRPIVYSMPEPCLGQLKFLALTSIPDVDESDDQFDGWTWPDGRTIQNTNGRFNQAAAYFGAGDNASQFTLPMLSDFFKPAKLDAQDSQLGSTQSQHDVLADHAHQIAGLQVESIAVKCPVSFYRSSTANKGPNVHAAMDSVNNFYLSAQLAFDVTELSISGDIDQQEMSGETYPSHNLLPVMIYIGKPKK